MKKKQYTIIEFWSWYVGKYTTDYWETQLEAFEKKHEAPVAGVTFMKEPTLREFLDWLKNKSFGYSRSISITDISDFMTEFDFKENE